MSVKVGLVGVGTVGGGCLEILNRHREDFTRHYGVDIEVVSVCSRRPDRARELGYGDVFVEDYRAIVEDPEIDLVVETVGGLDVAKHVVIDALSHHKSVVTANKALMATFGGEILALAARRGQEVLFEASVGGGIPIIGPLKHSLTANEITDVMGIVNGTTNYILTRMGEAGLDYADALAEAQQLGYAEADPTADVGGADAAAKIAILASIAFNSRVTLDDVHTEGITELSATDLEIADDMGYRVKLLAHAHRTDAGVDVRVHPTMLPTAHPLANVMGVFNAVHTQGDAVGENMFYGEGAGAGPAASAVMGDVIEAARRIAAGQPPLVGCTCTDELPFVPIEDLRCRYYLRFKVADRPGVLAATAEAFAHHDVSAHSVLQRGHGEADEVDLVYVTHEAREADVRAALAEICALDEVLAPGTAPVVVRLQD